MEDSDGTRDKIIGGDFGFQKTIVTAFGGMGSILTMICNSMAAVSSNTLTSKTHNDLTYEFFKDFSTIVVVDEFGNTGGPTFKENYFGFGVSLVTNPGVFGRIAQNLRLEHGVDEYKANDASLEDRILISKRICSLGIKTFACYVQKGPDMPEGMNHPKRYARIDGMLGCVLDEVLPKTGNIFVIVDWNNQYKGIRKVEFICESRSNTNRTVRGSMYNSKGSGACQDLLQVNDYVANAARIRLEDGLAMRSHIIGTHFRQIRRGTIFKEEDMK